MDTRLDQFLRLLQIWIDRFQMYEWIVKLDSMVDVETESVNLWTTYSAIQATLLFPTHNRHVMIRIRPGVIGVDATSPEELDYLAFSLMMQLLLHSFTTNADKKYVPFVPDLVEELTNRLYRLQQLNQVEVPDYHTVNSYPLEHETIPSTIMSDEQLVSLLEHFRRFVQLLGLSDWRLLPFICGHSDDAFAPGASTEHAAVMFNTITRVVKLRIDRFWLHVCMDNPAVTALEEALHLALADLQVCLEQSYFKRFFHLQEHRVVFRIIHMVQMVLSERLAKDSTQETSINPTK